MDSQGRIFSLPEITLDHQPPTFLTPGTRFMEDSFSMDWEQGWFLDDSSALYLLSILFLLLLLFFHLRLSGIRSQWLGTPALRACLPRLTAVIWETEINTYPTWKPGNQIGQL